MQNFTVVTNDPSLNPNSDTALVVIDVQKYFCDPEHRMRNGNFWTKNIAERTASLIPAFKQAGAKIYYVQHGWQVLDADARDFYLIDPKMADSIFEKPTNSAFRDSNCQLTNAFNHLLDSDGIKNLLICGVNLGACVQKTAVDARIFGYNVTVLNNLIARADIKLERPDHRVRVRETFQRLHAHNLTLKSSAAVLRELTARKISL